MAAGDLAVAVSVTTALTLAGVGDCAMVTTGTSGRQKSPLGCPLPSVAANEWQDHPGLQLAGQRRPHVK